MKSAFCYAHTYMGRVPPPPRFLRKMMKFIISFGGEMCCVPFMRSLQGTMESEET